jgi:hypothetical protein
MRDQKNYNEIIGITDSGEIYLLNYIFESTLHGTPFCGATGSILTPLTQAYVDSRNNIDSLKDTYGFLWQEAVKDGNTELGLDDYLQEMMDSEVQYGEGLFLGHDTSDTHHITDEQTAEIETVLKYKHEIIGYECIGGGRCFDRDITWKHIFRPDLLAEIKRVEDLNIKQLKSV